MGKALEGAQGMEGIASEETGAPANLKKVSFGANFASSGNFAEIARAMSSTHPLDMGWAG